MYPKSQIIRIFFFLSITSFCACSNDDENNETDNSLGTERYIINKIGEDLYSSVQSQNFTFFPGDTPPNMDAIFRANTLQIQYSNIENDPALNKYNDPLVYFFSNQNNENLTIKFGMRNDTGSATRKDEANIVGRDDRFTIFFDIEIPSNGYVNTYFQAVSGRLTSEGIEDFQYAFFMKKRDPNAPANEFFPTNTGRVFVETDELAENFFVTTSGEVFE